MDEIQQQIRVLEEKIANGEVIHIEMGTAYDLNFNEVPWRATAIPLAIVKSAQGPRLRCRVETGLKYGAFSADQDEGTKHLLIGRFRLIDAP